MPAHRRIGFAIVSMVAALLSTAIPGAAAIADPGACVRTLAALDDAGRAIFRTVALATNQPGVVAAPLHPLERGGIRWARLELRSDPEATGSPVTALAVRPERDLALLRTESQDPCPAVAWAEVPSDAPVVAGAPVRLFRERRGFRPGSIGGRVERVLALAGGSRLGLVHLLDEGGADPGLVVDAGGRLLGVAAPAPAGADPSLAVVVLLPAVPGTSGEMPGWSPTRDAISPRTTPSFWSTLPGLLSQAMVLDGPEGGARSMALLSEVIDRGGDAVSVRLERGVLEYRAGKLPAAIDDFRRAADMDPGSHLARFNLGVCLGAAGRYAEAVAAFRAARDLDPQHARTRYQLALALKAMRRSDEARGEYEVLSALDPALGADLRMALGL